VSNYIDLQDNGSDPAPGNASTSRIARVAGQLKASADGAPYVPIVPFGDEVTEANYAAQKLSNSGLMTYFRPLGIEGVSVMPQFMLGATPAKAFVSGALQLSTGTTSNCTAAVISGTDGANFSKSMRSAADWYFSGRFSIPTTPTTGTQLIIGGWDSSGLTTSIRVGVDVAVNATNYCMVGGAGSAIDSGIPFDVNVKHRFRAWRTGGVSFLQIDNNAPISGTANLSADVCPMVQAHNGTGANQALEIVWGFWAVPPL
jgi:hypothetical protein